MLTVGEKERIRYHLGYANLAQATVLHVGGIPAPYPQSWQIEANLNKILAESEPRVRDLLKKLDETEEQIFCAQKDLGASQVGNITINLNQIANLKQAYRYWQGALATLTMTVVNPTDQRFGVGANIYVDN